MKRQHCDWCLAACLVVNLHRLRIACEIRLKVKEGLLTSCSLAQTVAGTDIWHATGILKTTRQILIKRFRSNVCSSDTVSRG